MGQVPPMPYRSRVVSRHEIHGIAGERWSVWTVEVQSGPDMRRDEVAEVAAKCVAEIDRDEWDMEFERETGIDLRRDTEGENDD